MEQMEIGFQGLILSKFGGCPRKANSHH